MSRCITSRLLRSPGVVTRASFSLPLGFGISTLDLGDLGDPGHQRRHHTNPFNEGVHRNRSHQFDLLPTPTRGVSQSQSARYSRLNASAIWSA